MRLTIIVAVAAILTPAVLTAHPASQPGYRSQTTDLSAAKKKAKKPAKKQTEENLKAAPSAPPSGGKSMY